VPLKIFKSGKRPDVWSVFAPFPGLPDEEVKNVQKQDSTSYSSAGIDVHMCIVLVQKGLVIPQLQEIHH
jgi:hypothetical protein